jgi:hypothetical protein
MKNSFVRRFGKCVSLAVWCSVSGCSLLTPVQPWQKGMLARPEMTFGGDSLDLKNTEHVYQNRESASGGAGVGGGGCGCN